MSTMELICVDMESDANGGKRLETNPRHRYVYSGSGAESYLNIRRDPALKNLQTIVKQFADRNSGVLELPTFIQLFSQENVLALLFQLFDVEATGSIKQESFFCTLRSKLQRADERSFVDLLETVTYVINDEEDLDQETFKKVMTSRGVLRKLFRLIIDGKGISVTAEMLMNYLLELTFVQRPHALTESELKNIEDHFHRHNKDGCICLEDFRKMMPAKNPFFMERVFHLFDKDGSGSISFREFMQSVQQYCSQSPDDKASFIFQIYDIDGDGLIRVGELKSVLRACMEENGMKFSDDHLDDLTTALYEDANPQGSDGITFEQLKAQLQKHNGLLENMSINIERWLLAAAVERKKVSKLRTPSKWSLAYVKNNIVFLSFVAVYFAVNIILLIKRASDFWVTTIPDGRDIPQDYFYMLARGSGKTLHFNGMFILVLMLRRSITFLRGLGFANFLPLDQHVYLHKMCGVVILVMSVFHSIMHVCHFIFVVGDDWVIGNRTYSAVDWLFTTRPGVFGIVPGTASITGWVLLFIVFIISLCSMPFVRKGGYFEVFYWTHLLFLPFWILLVIHEEHFWFWIVVPGTIFAIELIVRFIHRLAGKGKTFISSAALLPSQVTHLVIKRPKDFDFQPGDYVFVNIPVIASSEWHPFTISSAPEDMEFISLHIRGLGGWTNKLYEYFTKQSESVASLRKIQQSAIPDDTVDNRPLVFKQKSCPVTTVKSEERHGVLRSPSDPSSGMKFLRNQPVTISVFIPPEKSRVEVTPRDSYAPSPRQGHVITVTPPEPSIENSDIKKPLQVTIDGPYGAPSSHIFHAEHAVLIAAGIGVTPFASILQSIMHRYWNSKQNCPNCNYAWTSAMPGTIRDLKKVDFFWINREQRSFEWFVSLLSQLEAEQAEKSGVMDHFLDMHMYITSGLQRTDLKAVGLQLALDLLYDKEHRDLITGLKTRTKAGRPNWNKVFQQLADQQKGRITVFYCGPPELGSALAKKCTEFGFRFRKEIF